MTRHLFIFLSTFLVGALVALGARTATHVPLASHAAHEAQVTDLKSQVPAASGPVNTHCAICGMAVDPKLPTLTYQGKTIGFGCKMCPPKFKAEPDKYGPYYLRNEVIKN
jgi:YHS domain-containing protein